MTAIQSLPRCKRLYVDAIRFDFVAAAPHFCSSSEGYKMKIVNSLKSLRKRDKNCRIVRRKGRVYVINKTNPRYKARQG